MDYSNFDNPFILQSAVVDKEDIDQEIELLRLSGITTNRRYVALRLQQQSEALFQGDPGQLAAPIVTRTLPPPEVINDLISWAIEQSDEISRAVLDFLSEPDDEALPGLLKKLRRSGLTATQPQPAPKKAVLSTTLLDYLKQKPRTKDELYDYTRTLHNAARPEAAVRQFLRRFTKEGVIELIAGAYHVK